MKKTHKVVMLPTEKASPLIYNNIEQGLFSGMPILAKHRMGDCTNQHLYILSDDEIKEGDWYILIPEDKVVHCKVSFDHKGHRDYKKIVATTDESIGYTDHRISPVPNFCDYPQLPESFIQAYIKAYNEGKSITEVNLEMDKTFHGYFDEGGEDWRCSVVKTRPDNTVIVHQSKMYSKKEVEKLCEKAFRAGREAQNNLNGNKCPSAWIQDNL